MRIVLLGCCLLWGIAAVAAPDTLDEMLAKIGMTRQTVAIDQHEPAVSAHVAHRLPIFDRWYGAPLRIPAWERDLRNALLGGENQMRPALLTSATALGRETHRDLIAPTPLEQYRAWADAPDALATAIRQLDPEATIPDPAAVPADIQRLTAMLLFAEADALRWRELALRKIPPAAFPELYAALSTALCDDETVGEKAYERGIDLAPYAACYWRTDLLERIDLQLFFAAADDLTAVLDAVADELAAYPTPTPFAYTCHTRYGDIRISGGSDDAYAAETHPLLILDLSGDDTYQTGGSTGGAAYPIGLLLDIAGNDTYQAVPGKPSFGAGVLGWGMLVDLAGNDQYRSDALFSQGCGIAGVGILRDARGEDRYAALSGSQGYGAWGLGLLLDGGGDDQYTTFTNSQGCGMPLGMGLLFDLAGHDRYTANDTDIRFPSAQSDVHNTSMSQGAGCGVRRDTLDGHSLAGGLGMLLDGAGDDSYTGGVFAQAVGYWYGIGVLDDRAGNDRYQSAWYAQSATAHYAVSYLAEGAGDDQYTTTLQCSAAAANDCAVSLLLDEGGNDTHTHHALALGHALLNSIALFVDLQGNDRYQADEDALGHAKTFATGGPRATLPTLGIFLDLGGKDRYPKDTVTDGKFRTQQEQQPLLLGIRVDRQGGSVAW